MLAAAMVVYARKVDHRFDEQSAEIISAARVGGSTKPELLIYNLISAQSRKLDRSGKVGNSQARNRAGIVSVYLKARSQRRQVLSARGLFKTSPRNYQEGISQTESERSGDCSPCT
jgi:hypothetical protein